MTACPGQGGARPNHGVPRASAKALRLLLPFIFPALLCAQTASQTLLGDILPPAAESALTNVLVGSAVTPDGELSYTHDLYLVKTDGSAPKRLTTFDSSNQVPGATAVAISPDGTHAAYLAVLNVGGRQSEQVHAIDPVTGADRLIYTLTTACTVAPCLYSLIFSRDGTQLIWGVTSDNSILIANYDGSGTRTLTSGLLNSGSVTTNDGRLFFSYGGDLSAIRLDGSGSTVILVGLPPSFTQDTRTFLAVSVDGTTYAFEDCAGFGPNNGNCELAEVRASTFSELDNVWGLFQLKSFSNDGSVAAWIVGTGLTGSRTLKINGQQIVASGVFDALLNGDGTLVVYSSGLSRRGAVWISDSTGANARPLFIPRTVYNGGITGLSIRSDIQLLSPGSYFSIYGTNFETASPLIAASTLPLPASLGGVSVTVNGLPVPIEAVTEWQINALLPQSVAAGPAALAVQFQDGFTISATANIAATTPVVAAAFHGATNTLVDYTHPAQAGEVLASYGFGLGVTSPGVTGGQAAPFSPLARTTIIPTVLVGVTSATITYSGLVPGSAGLYQVNFITPKVSPSGGGTLTWQTGDSTGPWIDFYVR